MRDRIATNLTHAAGRARGRAGRAGVRPRAVVHRALRTRPTRTQYEANLETVRISAKYFPIVEFAGVRRHRGDRRRRRLALVDAASSRSAPSPRSCSTSTTCSSRSSSSASSTTRCSRRARRCSKLFELLDTRPSVSEKPGAVDLPRARRDRGRRRVVRLRHRRRRCCTTSTLAHRAPGERLALVGPTGAGKSTLAKLHRPLLRPDRGHGPLRRRRPARRDDASRCASAIVVVPQEGFLFAGTIRDNVRVGRAEATDDEVDDRARGARPARAVRRVPRRPRHRGARARLAAVGGGEAARLARARRARRSRDARARRSDVEPRPRHRARRSSRRSRRLTEGRTVVVVAHRLSTAARCRPHRGRRRRPARRARHRTTSCSRRAAATPRSTRAWSSHHASPSPKSPDPGFLDGIPVEPRARWSPHG